VLIPAVSPLGFLVSVPVANAQCSGGSCGGSSGSAASSTGFLGGLLGGGEGGMQNMMMFMMLAMMLMQLFQGLGGSTPQTGTAEETPPQYGTVGPTNTGANTDSSSTAASAAGLASQSLFLAGSGSDQILSPTTLTVPKGNGFNFFNTASADQEVRIYKNGTTGLQVDQIVSAENVQVFTFQNTGTYKICLVNSGTESCQTTVTVQ
jgi:plastocyanin